MPSEADFHAQMANLYAQQRLKPEPRPAGVEMQDWKNRHRISAKISPDAYADLMAYCRERGLSVNSALRQILSAFFNHA
jgi:hypothetical protein